MQLKGSRERCRQYSFAGQIAANRAELRKHLSGEEEATRTASDGKNSSVHWTYGHTAILSPDIRCELARGSA